MFKKFLYILIVLLGCFSAQTICAQSISVRCGLTFPHFQIEDNFGSVDNNTSITGFHVGILYEQHILSFVGLETGFILNTRGSANDDVQIDPITPQDLEGRIRSLYIELPVHLKLTLPLENIRLSMFAGPTLSFGITGTSVIEGIYDGKNLRLQQDIQWGSAPDALQRVDIGLNGGFTMELYRVQIGLLYYIGLRNISNNTFNNVTLNNRALQLSAGYRFSL